MNGYVYIRSESRLWTVGFYKPDGKWEPESDHSSPEDAAGRVRWLNTGESVTTSADDVRPRTDDPGYFDVTCGNCHEGFGTNFAEDELYCPHCEARRCPHCRTWFGGEA